MAYTVNEIGSLTVVTGGGFAGDYATGWSAANYYHITDLNTAGSAQLHSFVIFYKGTQTDAGSNGELAIPLFGDKDNTGGITLGIDGGYLAISDGTTISRGSTLINDDVWHPIIFTVGDTTVKGYADGVLEVDVTPSNLSSVIINAIGNSAGATAYPTALDGIQIYDRFLFQFMVDDFQANIGGTSTPSTVSFITDNLVLLDDAREEAGLFVDPKPITMYISKINTGDTLDYTVRLIDPDFPKRTLQSTDALGFAEQSTVNATMLSEDYMLVNKPQLEGEEQDELKHRLRTLRIFYQDKITKEKWS